MPVLSVFKVSNFLVKIRDREAHRLDYVAANLEVVLKVVANEIVATKVEVRPLYRLQLLLGELSIKWLTLFRLRPC